MAIGKKLITLGCCAGAVSALLITVILVLFRSGKSVCMPGVSIRCQESDCGRFFQRCGSNELFEVPEDKVCYKGALVSASRTDLHSCPSTVARNSSNSQGPLGNCNCNSGCNYPYRCDCLCQCSSCTGTSTGKIEPVREVRCKSPVVRIYPSSVVAACCTKKMYSPQNCQPVPAWETNLRAFRRQFTKVVVGRWSLQDAAGSFVFPTPLEASCCYVTGRCNSVCG